MAELPTNFKDDILAEAMGGRRRYQMIQNEDGTVSFVDVTQYEQIGSDFGQAEINQTNEEVNKKFDSGDVVDPVTTTELGFAADAKLTGDALKDLNAKMGTSELDYEQAIPISGGFTAQQNGYLLGGISGNVGQGLRIIIDNIDIYYGTVPATSNFAPVSIPITKGKTYTTKGSATLAAHFIPFKS